LLKQLYIRNYALIEELTIDLSNGLTILTGETGAGKSIILGALGLVLGKRADTSSLKNNKEKCIVEAKFTIGRYNLKEFFTNHDLDFEEDTILRREIFPSGKSRAFVNDTPVTLPVINELKSFLIDIHSQNQTLQLSDANYQFFILDSLSKNHSNVKEYRSELKNFRTLTTELEEIERQQREVRQQYDYNLHLFNELEEAQLEIGEQEELESKLEKLNNVEDIKRNLSEAIHLSINDEAGLQNTLYALEQSLSKIAPFAKEFEELANRISSLKIEFDDILNELENENENVEYDPVELERLNDRLQLIFQLQKKHYVSTIEELLEVYESLSEKVESVENSEAIVNAKKSAIEASRKNLNRLSAIISKNRTSVLSGFQSEMENILSNLGMQHTKIQINLSGTNEFLSNGKDKLEFLVSTNKGASFGDLKKVASGGELSRIMLSIKRILSQNTFLPTVIFDEIDTGVSGEISNKIAAIMQEMSTNMQVLVITHLPQIAAKGKHHFKVFKQEQSNETLTSIKELSSDERIVEIAEMLSGKDVSESAITHAKELLN
jgi:DNA repair protein RecN (Recombination protein N)